MGAMVNRASTRRARHAAMHQLVENEFEEIELENVDQVRALRDQNSRGSKKQAHNFVRGALNATLASQCGHSQLAYAFLKYPTTNLDEFLAEYRVYMESSE